MNALHACAATVMLAAASMAATAAGIPAAFHGTWVRGDADCRAALSLTIEARRVSFRNAKQQQRYDRLEVCTTCNAPSDRSGTVQVLADAPDGSPFLLFLTPGPSPVVTLNWRPTERALPKRYPLAPAALKRCRK
jgi:hypothetical protein